MLFAIMAVLLVIGFSCFVYVAVVLSSGKQAPARAAEPEAQPAERGPNPQATLYPESVAPSTGGTMWTIAKPLIGFVLFVGALVGCVFIRWELAKETAIKPTVAPNSFQSVGKISKQTAPVQFAPRDK